MITCTGSACLGKGDPLAIVLPLERIGPEMVLAKDVADPSGTTILPAGTPLSRTTLEHLRALGVQQLWVDPPRPNKPLTVEPPAPVRDVVRPETREQATILVGNVFRDPAQVPLSTVVTMVKNIVDEVIKSSETVVSIQSLRDYHQYTYQHSVNLCVLGVSFAKILGFSQEDLRELGLGLLLHDYGKSKVPTAIIDKPAKLTDEEFTLMKTHPEAGWRLLAQHYDLPAGAQAVILQHHERINGTGYPYRLTADEIHLFAKIGMIVDVYDAMTSDRSYAKGRPPEVVKKFLIDFSGQHFDPDLIASFLPMIPEGSLADILQLCDF